MSRLVDGIERLFSGRIYRHRSSTNGDVLCQHFYEDLYANPEARALRARVDANEIAVTPKNLSRGVRGRRGDGALGVVVPGADLTLVPNFRILRGEIAAVHIGAENKILMCSMIKQIERVQNSLTGQAASFRAKSPNAITVAIICVNYADSCTTYEGDVAWPSGERGKPHPIAEAARAEQRLIENVAGAYDEFIFFRFRATNVDPFPFSWNNKRATEQDYSAALTRIAMLYGNRFGH